MASLQIYNSYSRQKEVFEPITPGHVGMYVCGPTVSGESHLGHARPYVTFDVGANCVLEDVLLFAPSIIFKNGFRGSIQAFASDQITAEENTHFSYPSVLAILQKEGSQEQAGISIGQQSEVDGAVVALQVKYFKNPIKVFVHEQVKIRGQVWVSGDLQLKGTVYGTVACDMFLLSTPSSVSKNFLLNAVIDQPRLPNAYVGPLIHQKPDKLAIAKWIK